MINYSGGGLSVWENISFFAELLSQGWALDSELCIWMYDTQCVVFKRFSLLALKVTSDMSKRPSCLIGIKRALLRINRLKIRPRFHARPVIQDQISLGESRKEEGGGDFFWTAAVPIPPPFPIHCLGFPLADTKSTRRTHLHSAASLTWVFYPIFRDLSVPICFPRTLGQGCPWPCTVVCELQF